MNEGLAESASCEQDLNRNMSAQLPSRASCSDNLRAVIFRLQLLKQSETFITTQALALPETEVLLVGRKLYGPPVPDLRYWVPEAMTTRETVALAAFGNVERMLPGIESFRPDVIHAHFAVDALYALPIKRHLRVPLITTLHGFDVTTRRGDFLASRRPSLMRYALLQKRLHAEGDLFICVSEFIRQRALEAGFPASRLRRHYMGINPAGFARAPENMRCDSILHVARLVEKKGTKYLVQAFAKIASKHSTSRLIIIGEGPLRPSLEALAETLGVRDRIDFLGGCPHAEVRSRLSQCRLLVLPSVTAANGDAEGLGMVLLEAAASEIPVVATRHGGIMEAVVDGETGLLVAERSSDELADAIDTVLANAGLSERLGRAGRQNVERFFNVHRQSALLKNLYLEMTTQMVEYPVS